MSPKKLSISKTLQIAEEAIAKHDISDAQKRYYPCYSRFV